MNEEKSTKRSPIQEEMDELRRENDELEKSIVCLEDRLSLVLRSEEPSDCCEAEAAVATNNLASSIGVQRKRTGRSRMSIQVIADRLEL